MSDYSKTDMPKECLWVYKNLVQPNYSDPSRPEVWLPEGVSPSKNNHRWSRHWNLSPLNWVNTGITRVIGSIDFIELSTDQQWVTYKSSCNKFHPGF
jgi:hypothetical protein